MDSSSVALQRKKGELSAEEVGRRGVNAKPASSPNFTTGSGNGSSLDLCKKKVGHGFGCENPHGAYFICEHGHPIYRTLPCHARFEVDCPACARKWRGKVINNIENRVKQMEYPVLVSLTLKKGGLHALDNLNALGHRCRKYLSREGCKGCQACKGLRGRERRKRRKNCERRKPHDIRGWSSCLEPPNHVHAVWDCDYIPQKELSEVWNLVTGDSIIVDIRKVDKQRWRKAVNYLAKYITQISRAGSSVDMSCVHVVNSWGNGGYYKKVRMVCKICGSYFDMVWFAGQVVDIDNDAVDFVEIDPG